MIAQAIVTARAAGASGKILVRGDSAYGNRAVVRACLRGNAEFSLVMIKNRAIQRAIASIPDTAWTPVRYPGAVQDPDTGAWISDAEVAEVTYTAFAATKDRTTARLVVRRVKVVVDAAVVVGRAATHERTRNIVRWLVRNTVLYLLTAYGCWAAGGGRRGPTPVMNG